MHSHNHETQVRLLDLTVSCVRCAVAQTARRLQTRAALFRAIFFIFKQFAGFFECLQLIQSDSQRTAADEKLIRGATRSRKDYYILREVIPLTLALYIIVSQRPPEGTHTDHHVNGQHTESLVAACVWRRQATCAPCGRPPERINNTTRTERRRARQ